jgi:DNA repair exonuclease SbcCD ATPase subunit
LYLTILSDLLQEARSQISDLKTHITLIQSRESQLVNTERSLNSRLESQALELREKEESLLNSQDTIEELEIDLNARRDRDILQDSIIVNQKDVIEKLEGSLVSTEIENKELNVRDRN